MERNDLTNRSRFVEPREDRFWRLEPRVGETLRSALERTLREAIVSGALRKGVRLPGSRTLARELDISRGVVTDAYAHLGAQGLVIVHSRAAPTVAGVPSRNAEKLERCADQPTARYDLTPTAPDVILFPLARWLATADQAAREAGPAAFDYRRPRGERELRHALADHLGRTRGVITDPDQILVTHGTAHGLSLLLRVLRERGAIEIAIEDPSPTTHQERIRAAGLALIAQPVDEDGLIVGGLSGAAVLVTPAHQFPTGSVLSNERRRALLAWATETGGLIIEDDCDAEFRYDPQPVRALQGLAPDRVVHLGSVSKTLAPALRLGWLVAPAALIDDLERERNLTDLFSPLIDQLTFARLLRRGEFDRHIRRIRPIYRRRRNKLHAALEAQLPELEVSGVSAGVHFLLQLPTETNDLEIALQAEKAHIRVPALSMFCIERKDVRGLVIGYGRVHESAVEPAIRDLAGIVRRHTLSRP